VNYCIAGGVDTKLLEPPSRWWPKLRFHQERCLCLSRGIETKKWRRARMGTNGMGCYESLTFFGGPMRVLLEAVLDVDGISRRFSMEWLCLFCLPAIFSLQETVKYLPSSLRQELCTLLDKIDILLRNFRSSLETFINNGSLISQ
jgi:hypothetical protein